LLGSPDDPWLEGSASVTPQEEPGSDLSAVPKDLIAVADDAEFAELSTTVEC